MASIHMRTIRWETKDGEERTGRRYQARYRDRSGQEHARLFKLKRDAQRWLNEQTAGIVTGQWADPRAGKQTFKTYAENWRTRQVHADTTELQVESNPEEPRLPGHRRNEAGLDLARGRARPSEVLVGGGRPKHGREPLPDPCDRPARGRARPGDPGVTVR